MKQNLSVSLMRVAPSGDIVTFTLGAESEENESLNSKEATSWMILTAAEIIEESQRLGFSLYVPPTNSYGSGSNQPHVKMLVSEDGTRIIVEIGYIGKSKESAAIRDSYYAVARTIEGYKYHAESDSLHNGKRHVSFPLGSAFSVVSAFRNPLLPKLQPHAARIKIGEDVLKLMGETTPIKVQIPDSDIYFSPETDLEGMVEYARTSLFLTAEEAILTYGKFTQWGKNIVGKRTLLKQLEQSSHAGITLDEKKMEYWVEACKAWLREECGLKDNLIDSAIQSALATAKGDAKFRNQFALRQWLWGNLKSD